MKVVRRMYLAIVFAAGVWSRHGWASDAPAPDPSASPTPTPAAVASPAPSEPASGGEPGAATQRESGSASRTLRTLGWVSVAIGAEAAVVASVTSFMLLHEKAVRDEECNAQKLCSRRGLDANSAIATLVGWNTAAWILTAAGLGAGAYLLFTHRPDSKPTATIAVAPNPTGVEIGLHGAF